MSNFAISDEMVESYQQGNTTLRKLSQDLSINCEKVKEYLASKGVEIHNQSFFGGLKSERNAKLYEDYINGTERKDLIEKYEISYARIAQILHKYAQKFNKPYPRPHRSYELNSITIPDELLIRYRKKEINLIELAKALSVSECGLSAIMKLADIPVNELKGERRPNKAINITTKDISDYYDWKIKLGDIAEREGVSYMTIVRRLKRLGVKFHPLGSYPR